MAELENHPHPTANLKQKKKGKSKLNIKMFRLIKHTHKTQSFHFFTPSLNDGKTRRKFFMNRRSICKRFFISDFQTCGKLLFLIVLFTNIDLELSLE